MDDCHELRLKLVIDILNAFWIFTTIIRIKVIKLIQIQMVMNILRKDIVKGMKGYLIGPKFFESSKRASERLGVLFDEIW